MLNNSKRFFPNLNSQQSTLLCLIVGGLNKMHQGGEGGWGEEGDDQDYLWVFFPKFAIRHPFSKITYNRVNFIFKFYMLYFYYHGRALSSINIFLSKMLYFRKHQKMIIRILILIQIYILTLMVIQKSQRQQTKYSLLQVRIEQCQSMQRYTEILKVKNPLL